MMLLEFKTEHLECMDIREIERNSIFSDPNISGRLSVLASEGFAYTLLEDGRIIACGGICPIMPGVATAWIIPSEWVPQYSKTFVKVVKAQIDKMMEDMNLHRVETTCVDDELHSKWMEHIGFECEGVKKWYDSNKNNYKIFAKLRGVQHGD